MTLPLVLPPDAPHWQHCLLLLQRLARAQEVEALGDPVSSVASEIGATTLQVPGLFGCVLEQIPILSGSRVFVSDVPFSSKVATSGFTASRRRQMLFRGSTGRCMEWPVSIRTLPAGSYSLEAQLSADPLGSQYRVCLCRRLWWYFRHKHLHRASVFLRTMPFISLKPAVSGTGYCSLSHSPL